MIPFTAYINRAVDQQNLSTLLVQRDCILLGQGTLHCECGTPLTIASAFRCLYCGIYRCSKCAEEHFGQTFAKWAEDHKKVT